MSCFLLLPSGDLDLSLGSIQITQAQQEILQTIRAAVREFAGEWFLDSSRGLPFFTVILQKGTDQDVITNLFKNAVLAVDGVIEVGSASLAVDARGRSGTLTLAQVKTIHGNITTSIPVGQPATQETA